MDVGGEGCKEAHGPGFDKASGSALYSCYPNIGDSLFLLVFRSYPNTKYAHKQNKISTVHSHIMMKICTHEPVNR